MHELYLIMTIALTLLCCTFKIKHAKKQEREAQHNRKLLRNVLNDAADFEALHRAACACDVQCFRRDVVSLLRPPGAVFDLCSETQTAGRPGWQICHIKKQDGKHFCYSVATVVNTTG